MERCPDLDLDELVAAAWPAPSTQDMGGWLLRHDGGVTKRANSVLPCDDRATWAREECHPWLIAPVAR